MSDKIDGEIDKLLYTYNINRVIRYRQVRQEKFQTQSVAEHIANMLFLAYYFKDKEMEYKDIDFDKVIRIIIMHDLGEIETGDEITSFKNSQHLKNEKEAISVVAEKSPEFVSKEISQIFNNFENKLDRESVFVKGLDVMDGILFWQYDNGEEMLHSMYKSDDEFFEKERTVYNKKIEILKKYNLDTMAAFYERVFKRTSLYKKLF